MSQAQANNAYCGNSLVRVFTITANFRTTLCITHHPSPITHDGLSNQYNYWLSRVPSELIDFLIKIQTSWDQGLLLELIDSDQHTISCDQELLSELIDSLIDTQTSCDQELSSELIDSLIIPQLLVIRSSHQSSLTPLLTHKLYKIRSFYQSSLTPTLRYKLPGIKSSHQSSLIP